MFRRLLFEFRLLQLSVVIHVAMAFLLGFVSAATCRMLLLMPFWLGAVIGVVLYVLIILGIRAEDRFE
jgi:hypothetical protein